MVEKGKDAVPKSINDIQNFYIVLHPHKKRCYRMIIVGRKRLPQVENHQKYWAFIDLVVTKSDELKETLRFKRYTTRAQREHELPAARACGEGTYVLVSYENATYFVYQLIMPPTCEEVQKSLNIMPKASYIITVKNQIRAGVRGIKEAKFPSKLQDKFRDRRFIPVNPVSFLNYPGAEILLIGVSNHLDNELCKYLEKVPHSSVNEPAATRLTSSKKGSVTKPLFKGQWA